MSSSALSSSAVLFGKIEIEKRTGENTNTTCRGRTTNANFGLQKEEA